MSPFWWTWLGPATGYGRGPFIDPMRARMPRERRRFSREAAVGIFLWPLAAISTFLLIVATVLTLASAIHLPEAMADGLPTRQFSERLNTQVFFDYPQWPELLEHLGAGAGAALALLAVAGLMLVRRGGGSRYMLRAAIGAGLLLLSAALAGWAFHPSIWLRVAEALNEHRKATATALFMDGFETHRMVLAAAMFILAQILLSMPPRQRALPPAPRTTKEGEI